VNRLVRATIAGLIAGFVVFVGQGHAIADGTCPGTSSADFTHAYAAVECTGQEAIDLANSEPGHQYTVHQICHGTERQDTTGDNCANPKVCPGPPPGILYDLYRDGERYGTTCLSPVQATHFGQITPGYVAEQWQDLDWETAELTLQPPDGKTLVNLATVFSTTMSPQPQTITVTLLGIPVTIEATPTTWTWHSDAGDKGWPTDNPGTPYTDGADTDSLNTFSYLDTGTVTPSVDVTYTGRFRVNGGAWQDIPGDLTKQGATVTLEVLPAGAHLTGVN